MVKEELMQEQAISPIGLLNDFTDWIHYLSNATYQSDNLLQVYNLFDNKYLQWISDEDFNVPFSTPEEILKSINSKTASNSNVIPFSTMSFDEKYKKVFFNIIKNTVFEPGEDNLATRKFAELISENKDATLKLINSYFIEHFKDECICVKLLTLLNDYSYDELYPYSQTIAIASLSNKASRVKSAAYNMFAHWGNKKSLELLDFVTPPSEPWIRKKYDTIKATLEKRCSMLEK